jgi:hypothetical protein
MSAGSGPEARGAKMSKTQMAALSSGFPCLVAGGDCVRRVVWRVLSRGIGQGLCEMHLKRRGGSSRETNQGRVYFYLLQQFSVLLCLAIPLLTFLFVLFVIKEK